MNLVQQQEALRTLPLPMLQMKAQGQDPSTPPWLAAAVLSERMAAQQKAGIAQGAAQGKQPSVVEQLEQKAGLMALQNQQQQQAQQQMMQQMAQAPQPAPEQVPQPEAQPEPAQMMARGGIARLPVDERMFNYKEGGIIGFANAGAIPERLPGESFAEYRQRVIDLQEAEAQAAAKAKREADEADRLAELARRGGPRISPFVQPMTAPAKVQAPAVAPQQVPAVAQPRPPVITSTAPGRGQVGRDDSSMTNAPLRMTPELEAFLRADAEREGIGAPVFNFRGPKGGIAGLARQPEEQPTPASAPQVTQPAPQAGLAALKDPLAEAKRFAAEIPKPEQLDLARVRALRQQALREAGLPEDVGASLQEGIGRYEAESERIRKAREKADALYVLSGRGGLGDIAARAAHRESVNALADSIRNDKANEMRTAMAAARRAEAMGDVAEVRRQMDIVNKANEEIGKATVTAATALAGQRTQERGQTLQAQTAQAQIGSQEKIQADKNAIDVKIAKIQADAREEAKKLGVEEASIKAAEQAFAADPRVKMMMKKVENAIVPFKPEEMKDIENRLMQIQSEKYIAQKLPDPNANKAQSPVNRMRFDAKGNPIP